MKRKYIKIYCILTLAAIAELFLIAVFNHGEKLNYYFFKDTLDTGMDFFNSVLYTKGGHPYTQFGTIYPPLANLFFWFVSSCVPQKFVAVWPDTFKEGVAIRGTSVDLRVTQVPMMCFILYIIIVSVLFVVVFSYAYTNIRLGMLNGIVFLFSFGSLYAFERGNIITLAILFLFVFLMFYDSDRKILRETALIALAVSAGLKLYPAFFGIMLLLERRWKEAFRTVLYGILFFFVPFAFFDGVNGFKAFVNAMFRFVSKGSVLDSSGYSGESLIRSILFQCSGVFGFDYETAAQSAGASLFAIKCALIVLLVAALIFMKDRWKRLLYIGILILLIQKSGNYTLLFLLPGLFQLFRADGYSKRNWLYFILLCILSLPLPVFGSFQSYGPDFVVMIKQDAFIITLLLICFDLVWNMTDTLKIHRKKSAILQMRRREKNNMVKSDDIKRVQEINKKILNEIHRVCQKYNICYYLDCGALLGAVRHHAFIPWDDDADISFTREHYKRFEDAVGREWDNSCFLLHKPEDFKNDKWLDFIPRIVYLDETADLNIYDKIGKEAAASVWERPAVDVFIIDNIPDQISAHKRLCRLLAIDYGLAMGHRNYIDYREYKGFGKFIIFILSHIGKLFSVPQLVERYNRHCMKYTECEGADCFYGNFSIKDMKKRYKREWYKEVEMVSIDGISYNAPGNYDMVLRMNYGDYMKLPPKEKQIPNHFRETVL